jgi:hypothetical protein
MECRFEGGSTEAMWNVVPIAPPVFLLFFGCWEDRRSSSPALGQVSQRRASELCPDFVNLMLRAASIAGRHAQSQPIATSASATRFTALAFE